LQLYSVKVKINCVNTPTDVLKEFRGGAITTSSGIQFQVWTESGLHVLLKLLHCTCTIEHLVISPVWSTLV